MENFIGGQAKRARLEVAQGAGFEETSLPFARSTATASSMTTTAASSIASGLPRKAFFLSMKLVTDTLPETAPLILRAFNKGMGFEHAVAKLYQVIESGDFRRLPTAEALATDLTAYLESDPLNERALGFDTLCAFSGRISHLMELPAVNFAIASRAAEISQVLLNTLTERSGNFENLQGQLTLGHVRPLLALLNSAISRPEVNVHLLPTRDYLTAKHAELQAIANIHLHGVDAAWGLPAELRNSRAVAMAIFAVDGEQLEHAREEWKRDPEMVIIAVQETGWVLQYAHPDVQDNFDVVLAAVLRNGYALEFASVNRKNDPDIVLAAVMDDPDALEFTNDANRDDPVIAKAAVERNGLALRLLSANRQNDKDIVLTAVKRDGIAVRFAHVDQQNDLDVGLAAVQQNGMALEFLSINLRNNPDIVTAAILQNSNAFQFAGDEIQNQNWLRI